MSKKLMARVGFIGVLLLLVCSMFLFMGSGKEESASGEKIGEKFDIEFAVVPKSLDNPVFFATKAGAEVAAEELGIKLIYTGPVADESSEAARIVEDLINRGVDGIAVSVSNAESMTPIIKQAYDKNIPVITWDSDAPTSKRSIYYGSPNFEIGQLVAEHLAKALGGKGKVAIFQVLIGHPNLDERYEGMVATFKKYPNIQIVQRFTTTAIEIVLAVDAVESYIAAHPEVNGLATTTGFPWWGNLGSMPSVVDRVKKGTLKCVGVDPLPAALDYVEAGVLTACIGQRFYEMGYGGVRLLASLAVSGPLNKYLIDHPLIMSSGLDVVTKSGGGNTISSANYKKMWAEWEAKK
ncbi:MAG: substrate-binding domain-containing protein [Spirochaetes bacterium]|nr:substrate-binding domain-containing protein [Spirochaetota bacterium]